MEAIIIKYSLNLSWWKATLLSLVCNLVSFLIWQSILNKDSYLPLNIRHHNAIQAYSRISGIIVLIWAILYIKTLLKNQKNNR
jgi:hypothetical protein